MKTKLKIVFVALFCSIQINAQTKQEVFSSIQKLVDKTTGEKIKAGDVFAKKDERDKIGKQVFTEKEVTVNTIPKGKSKYEWISRTTEIMWNEFLDYLIYTEFKNSNLQIVELNFKKNLKNEHFTSDDISGSSGNKFYSKFKFYILTSDKKELEQLLKRLYELKEKKLVSSFNKEIEKFNKQQTITWLKDKLSNTIAGDDYTTSLKLISFDDCNLVYEYTNLVGRKYQETIPTSIESIDQYNRFTYGKKSCISKSFAFGIIQKEDEITYKDFSFLKINSKDEYLISNIECAIKHLADFCNGTLTNISATINTEENKVAATQEITKEQKEYYDNGKLKSIGKFTNGKANGEWKNYYENGQLKQIGNLIGGKVTGECKNYHENGQLSQIGNFIDGISTGEWKFYNKNGELIAKKLYDVNGKEIENTNETKETKYDFSLIDVDDYDFLDIVLPELQKGFDLLEKKEFKNAIIEFDTYIKKNPHKTGTKCNCDAFFYRGKSKYFSGNFKEAIDDLNVIVESSLGNPKLQEGLFYRGLSKINLKQMDAGCLDLYKAKEKFPGTEVEIEKYCK